jgi:glutamate racemase
MWVPLIENNEHNSVGADYFVRKNIEHLMASDPIIDTVILGCTHYPLLLNKINHVLPTHINIVTQGEIVAKSLSDYLKRHPQMDAKCTKKGEIRYFTTESVEKFSASAMIFLNENIEAEHLDID